jgi:putative oxidoreductase
MRLLRSRSDLIYSAARAVAGFLFLAHGAQKLFGALGAEQSVAPLSMLGIAGLIELVGGTLIMLGLYTPLVAFVCSGEMAAAYFIAHAPQGFWPIVNQGELAVLYCFVFLYFASRGSGPLSLDRLLGRG